MCPDRIKANQKSGNVNPADWIWYIRPTMTGNARSQELPERAASTKVSAMGVAQDAVKSASKGKVVGSKLDWKKATRKQRTASMGPTPT